MSKALFFALAVVLACFVASAAAQSSTTVSAGQIVVLQQIVAEWPWLATGATKPWTEERLDQACIGGLRYIRSCNDSGWIQIAEFLPDVVPPKLVPIPPSIASMTALVTLKIGAFFNGTLDLDLGQLSALKQLWIEDAVFSTPFPSSWSGLVSLEEFTWQNVPTQEAQPFPAFLEGMAALKTLHLFVVNISGTIPNFVGELPALSNFQMRDVPKLVGPIPSSITTASKLQILTLTQLPSFDKGVSNSMPFDWSDAPTLTSIAFTQVPIAGSLPTSLPPNLLQFWMTGTRLSGAIPSVLVNHPKLSSLIIAECDISGTIPAPTDLENSKLNSLQVRYTKVTSVDEKVFRVKNLQTLDIGFNKITGILPQQIGFNDDSQLSTLGFNNNEFVGPIPSAYFAKTPRLRIFYAQNNNLSGELPSTVADSRTLTYLDVSGNSLSGQIPGDAKWAELIQLRTIIMKDNYFNGSIPSGLILRPQNATVYWNSFDFVSNRIDLCLLPSENYSVPLDFAQYCRVGYQTPPTCGCPDAWPSTCSEAIPAECPPAEPIAPFPVAPFSLTPTPGASPSVPSTPGTSPSSSPLTSPARGAPTPSHANLLSANLLSVTFVFALSAFIALAWA